MATPTYTSGTVGNLFAAAAIAGGGTVNTAVLLSVGTVPQTQLTCQMYTGASAPNAGTRFEVYHALGAVPQTTLTSSPSASATTFTVASITGLVRGQRIAVVAVATGIGEVVTQTAAPSGSTLTVSALKNSYTSGDSVIAIEEIPSQVVTPAPAASQSYATNTNYSKTLYLDPSNYVVLITNGDTGSVSITAQLTTDKITAY